MTSNDMSVQDDILACSTSWLGFPVGSAFRFAEVLVSEVQACPAGLCRRDSPPFDLQPPLGGETLKVLVSGVVDASFLIIYLSQGKHVTREYISRMLGRIKMCM